MISPRVAKRFRLSPPQPSERDLHRTVASFLDRCLTPPAFWFTYPAGASELTPQQFARHSEIGLKRGLPDIWLLHGRTYCIELKRHGGQLSKTRVGRTRRGSPRILVGQIEVFPKLIQTGAIAEIAVCQSLDDVVDALTRWQVPFRRPLVSYAEEAE
jgi:hypothetical protein